MKRPSGDRGPPGRFLAIVRHAEVSGSMATIRILPSASTSRAKLATRATISPACRSPCDRARVVRGGDRRLPDRGLPVVRRRAPAVCWREHARSDGQDPDAEHGHAHLATFARDIMFSIPSRVPRPSPGPPRLLSNPRRPASQRAPRNRPARRAPRPAQPRSQRPRRRGRPGVLGRAG